MQPDAELFGGQVIILRADAPARKDYPGMDFDMLGLHPRLVAPNWPSKA